MPALSKEALLATYRRGSPLRPDVLFTRFLPEGYRLTTLNSVPRAQLRAVVFAKLHLGMLITLYDDLADHPAHRDPALLERLYRLNLGRLEPAPPSLSGPARATYALASELLFGLEAALHGFPNFAALETVLRFDIEQFYACNRYSELVTGLPAACSLRELRCLGPHNMGMIAAGTIDLMASPSFQIAELARCRDAFALGQRLGRISNMLFTEGRERAEGDSTSEVFLLKGAQARLREEYERKLARLRARKLRSFGVEAYAAGIARFHELHAALEGHI